MHPLATLCYTPSQYEHRRHDVRLLLSTLGPTVLARRQTAPFSANLEKGALLSKRRSI